MKYVNKEKADKMTAQELTEILSDSFKLFYTPYGSEEQGEVENTMRLELLECIKEKILSGKA